MMFWLYVEVESTRILYPNKKSWVNVAVTPEMLASVKGGDKGISWDLAEEENEPSIESTPELHLMKVLQFVQRALFVALEY